MSNRRKGERAGHEGNTGEVTGNFFVTSFVGLVTFVFAFRSQTNE